MPGALAERARRLYTKEVFDVIPPSRSTGLPPSSRRENSSRRGVTPFITSRRKTKAVAASPSVVKVDWKLPARLRRPVRQELARQRHKQRQRKAIIQFERRPLYSELPTSYPSYQGRGSGAELRGAEQHTGDIYRESKPELQLPMPPYRNSRATANRVPTVANAPVSRAKAQGERSKVARKIVTRAAKASPQFDFGRSLRDVPYDWQATTVQKRMPADLQLVASGGEGKPISTVQPPRRRFALPLHFSIFPLSLLPRRRVAAGVKKKITLPRLV